MIPFVNIVENSCLIHDIGNPPFGHFGETAIKKWFEDNWGKYDIPLNSEELTYFKNKNFLNDFLYFDGNPQGMRIVIHLQEAYPNHDDLGFNLTCTQLLASLKYLRSTDEEFEDKKI